jgi:hypothetical protein
LHTKKIEFASTESLHLQRVFIVRIYTSCIYREGVKPMAMEVAGAEREEAAMAGARRGCIRRGGARRGCICRQP